MVVLTQTNDKLIIGSQGEVLILAKNDLSSQRSIEIPKPNLPHNLTKEQKEVITLGNKDVICICCSSNSNFVAVSTENKQVVLFDSEFKVLRNFVSNRVVSKISFTGDNDLLLLDKTGDVTLYKVKSEECEVILGHLSMLLDIKLSDCGRFVITCDRDEKIRVSHFPNAYNIQSYCLGHKEFVTNVEVYGDLLISASGDGTVRFWEFLKGKQLSMIDTNEQVEDKTLVQRFCNEMDQDKVEVIALPIKNMQLCKRDNCFFIAVSLMYIKKIFLYESKVNFPEIKISFLRIINCDAEILDFSFNTDLYILTTNQIKYFKLKNNFVEGESLITVDKLKVNNLKGNDISLLYKRRFDNVQEYLERKKLRLDGRQ